MRDRGGGMGGGRGEPAKQQLETAISEELQ